MFPMRVILVSVLAALLTVPVAGQEQQETIVADRPGLADGASTVGRGVFQIETGVTVDRQGDESWSLPTLLRIGLGDRIELRIDSDVLGRSSDGSDLAPVAVGFKLRLTNGAMPLSLLANVQPPSGGGSRRTTGFEGEARLVSDIELGGGFALTPNAGLSLVEGGDATGLFAMTLEKEIGNALPFIDFETSFGHGDTSVIADAGVAWIVRPHTQLDVSAGVDVAGDEYPEWFIAAGFSRRF